MGYTYIVVADAGQARLFRLNRPAGLIEEIEEMFHPQSRLRERQLDADRPGRHVGARSGSRHAVNSRDESKHHEESEFAREISKWLEDKRRSDDCDGLILIAAPHFLGDLRSQLSEQCKKLVLKSIDKDLLQASEEEVLDFARDNQGHFLFND